MVKNEIIGNKDVQLFKSTPKKPRCCQKNNDFIFEVIIMDMIDCINYFYSGLDLLEIWPLSLTKWTGSHLNVCSYFKFIAVKEIYFKYLCIEQI